MISGSGSAPAGGRSLAVAELHGDSREAFARCPKERYSNERQARHASG
jgi:hypothetical protein